MKKISFRFPSWSSIRRRATQSQLTTENHPPHFSSSDHCSLSEIRRQFLPAQWELLSARNIHPPPPSPLPYFTRRYFTAQSVCPDQPPSASASNTPAVCPNPPASPSNHHPSASIESPTTSASASLTPPPDAADDDDADTVTGIMEYATELAECLEVPPVVIEKAKEAGIGEVVRIVFGYVGTGLVLFKSLFWKKVKQSPGCFEVFTDVKGRKVLTVRVFMEGAHKDAIDAHVDANNVLIITGATGINEPVKYRYMVKLPNDGEFRGSTKWAIFKDDHYQVYFADFERRAFHIRVKIQE